MTKQDKENLQNKKLTDSLLVSCLAACEPVISKNAYLEKKWANCGQSYNGCYEYERLEWMRYREKLRSLLLPVYSMKMIIQMTKKGIMCYYIKLDNKRSSLYKLWLYIFR